MRYLDSIRYTRTNIKARSDILGVYLEDFLIIRTHKVPWLDSIHAYAYKGTFWYTWYVSWSRGISSHVHTSTLTWFEDIDADKGRPSHVLACDKSAESSKITETQGSCGSHLDGCGHSRSHVLCVWERECVCMWVLYIRICAWFSAILWNKISAA